VIEALSISPIFREDGRQQWGGGGISFARSAYKIYSFIAAITDIVDLILNHRQVFLKCNRCLWKILKTTMYGSVILHKHGAAHVGCGSVSPKVAEGEEGILSYVQTMSSSHHLRGDKDQ
jgi:hypothetical protein